MYSPPRFMMKTTTPLTVLISGAGIAGPALAYWLRRGGDGTHRRRTRRRVASGRTTVDFRGPVHRDILERMDLWTAVHERQTHLGEHAMLTADGRVSAMMPAFMLSGDVEIQRRDLSQILYERTVDETEYLFGDEITALRPTPECVEVDFLHRELAQLSIWWWGRMAFTPMCAPWHSRMNPCS